MVGRMTFGSTGVSATRIKLGVDLQEAVMTATLQDQSSVRPPREEGTSRLLVRELVAAAAIVAMWVAVLFVGVYGGEATFHSVDSSVTTVPSGFSSPCSPLSAPAPSQSGCSEASRRSAAA